MVFVIFVVICMIARGDDMTGMRIASGLPDETEQLVQQTIGAAIEVHRHLGPGYIEPIYGRALCHEFGLRGIAYQAEKPITVPYKDIRIPGQRLDVVVGEKVILELKAVEAISPIHEAQILSYLKSTGIRVGLIINFKVMQLKQGVRRFVL